MRPNALTSSTVRALLVLVVCLAAAAALAGTQPVELVDLMKMRTIRGEVISEDGAWVAYELRPDRGDGELVVRSTEGDTAYAVPRGSGPAISSDSRWVAAKVEPSLEETEKARKAKETGDKAPKAGLALVSTADGSVVTVPRVKSFAFSEDGRWLAYHRFEPEEADEAAEGEAGEAPEEEGTAEEPEIEGVPQPALPVEPPPEPMPELEPPPPGVEPEPGTAPQPQPAPEPEPAAEREEDEKKNGKAEDERVGSPLVLRELATGLELEIPHVESYAFDHPSAHLAYTVAAPGGEGNGLYLRVLGDEALRELPLRRDLRGRYTALAWTGEDAPVSRLGFVAALDEEDREEDGGKDAEPGDGTLHVWDGELVTALASEEAPEGWFVPSVNELAWSEDGERLFFGLKPVDEKPPEDEEEDEEPEEAEEGEGEESEGEEAEEPETPFDPYDVEALLDDRGVDVWGGADPLIVSHQKERWKEEKDRTYRAVYHVDEGRSVPLADREMRVVEPVDNPVATVGAADVPYLREITWDGWYFDVYRVSLADGSRQLVARHLRESPVQISPRGRYVVYWRSPHWYLFDGETSETRNLTEALDVPFADEDHDYPEPAPGYGVADWLEDDSAVLLYDKYDLWSFPTGGGEPVRVTDGEGRRSRTVFRMGDLWPEEDHVPPGARLLLTAYDDRQKHQGFAEARLGEPGVRFLEAGLGRFYRFEARAEEAERMLYTRESYTEFPDLWVSDLSLDERRKVSEANPGLEDHAPGEAELVECTGADGLPLQGVLIKPAGYEEGTRYPVLVYFYRLFSQRLHRFNDPAVNHRPSFPYYASHGYAVFLPDIRFDIGRPGHSATQALISGVQKLVEMGVADPARIGLHGHSWSGYQTAFVVTQTDLFAAAVAGAPVSNMTSAYGGIRYESGLARMFQYEQSQSRMGATLWNGRDRYIESSPLFYADRIETPLLIQFGDRDGAVPWTQGIELYLAMRRLGKDVWFLQYRGEGHHLEDYPNKLDYSIKMREFFDHYLKGEPAPEWMTEGVPYRGE
jgi:dipeptidyl aminopeptidase/acylaminoacyl peptidase